MNSEMREWDGIRIAVTVAVTGLVVFALGRQLNPKLSRNDPHQSTIEFTIDLSQSHPISPLIYGMAHASPEVVRDLRLGLNRWGGNPNTRYNWEINAWNHARDWQWSNYGDKAPAARLPGASADGFISGNQSAGAETYLTIPTIGWVAKDIEDSSRSLNVPAAGGNGTSTPEGSIPLYDPTANRESTSVASFPRKKGQFTYPPVITDGAVYQDEWLNHLKTKFGSASAGGVRHVAMDNEPDIWDVTHTDVHPARMGYDDLLNRYLQYATAVKDVDPTLQIGGPVSWGWTGYFHSPKDRDNYGARPDRKAHNDEPFIPWFLHSVREHDQRSGRRTLDVLDIHYYPQANGVYSKSIDPEVSAVRLRSTRSLWDKTYKDESWINEPVMLIPRMKTWIHENYPGTKLGLMEWNWGGEESMSGALAIADCLGTFGREGLDMAAYWTSPPVNSPAYLAFKMFRNADGAGAGFGDQSVNVTPVATGDISCYASSDHGKQVIILVNKHPSERTEVSLKLTGVASKSTIRSWQFGGENSKAIRKLPDESVDAGRLKIFVPPYSITLFRQK